MFYTYILQSQSTGKLYIGSTQNIEERIKRHNSGRSNYTRNKGPWIILFSIIFDSRSEAISLEYKLKAGKNSSKIKEWIMLQKDSSVA
jgi:putative endonuclease